MAEPATTTKHEPTGTLARLGNLAWQALPAIAGAISVLGFVTLVGGAIVWVRFWSAGLPADQAVRAMPRQELITIGAVSLVSFAVAGVLVVLLLYLLDRNGSASVKTFRGLVVLAVAEWVVTLLAFTEYKLGTEIVVFLWFGAAAVLAYLGFRGAAAGLERTTDDEPLRAAWAAFQEATDRRDDAEFRMALTPDAPPPNWPAEHFRREAVKCLRCQREWDRALTRWRRDAPAAAAAAADELPRVQPPSEAKLEAVFKLARDKATGKAEEKRTFWRPAAGIRTGWLLLSALLLLPPIVFCLIDRGDNEVILASTVGIVVVLAAANFAVARLTTGFAWYGVTALASLVLFGAAANIVKTVREPQVQPMALVRKSDGAAFCGVYVTETDKRIYIGRIQGGTGDEQKGADAKAGRMFWIPLDDVQVVTIGPIQDMEDADWRAPALTKEVLADVPAKRASAPPTNEMTTTKRFPKKRGVAKTTTLVEQVEAAKPKGPGETKQAEAGSQPSAAGSRPPDDMRCWKTDVSEQARPG